jgi:nucleoside-diphosphate-sugar epimerase
MVTGCAGFIGKAVSREIVAKGESIIGLYHNKLPEALDRMMPLCADLLTSDALLAPLRSVECVIHLGWVGGVLGSDSVRGGSQTSQDVLSSKNVLMTTNLVRAMERQGVKRIIFLSWIGAQDKSDKMVLREKYWAENVILNSSIPEKIIIRTGAIVDPNDRASDFAAATQRLSKVPLVTPLPSIASDVVFTSRKDLVARIVSLATHSQTYTGSPVEELTSTAPVSSSEALMKFQQKWWGQQKMSIGGFIGRYLFSLIDNEFGRLPAGRPKIADYLSISRSKNLLTESPSKSALLP